MTTERNDTFRTTRTQYLQNVQRDMDRWRQGYERLETSSPSLSTQDQSELRRQWLELESAYRDLQQTDDASWETASARVQRSTRAFHDTWLIVVTRVETEDENEIGWLRGFTDDLTSSSGGWLEGVGEQEEASEGWTEGYDAVHD